MKTVSHTPGPWNVLMHTRYPDNGGETERVEIHGDGTEICQVPIEDSQDTDEHQSQREANARLIAAAPELLDLLCRALPFVEDAEDELAYKAGFVRKLTREIRAAIAKAKGGDA